jgi:alkanesulfonate monooxygenase SsuD/methylene tetrahydromethanopterin reductase-like flavin-dependent oxidoreductase (luciferase family)
VRCTPKPVRQPIPIFVGAAQGEAVRRAARLGDGLLSAGPRTRRWYRQALTEDGKNPDNADIVAAGRFLFCSEDPARD